MRFANSNVDGAPNAMAEPKTTNATLGVILLLWAPLTVWDGFIVSHLWNWFAVPFFHAPTLSIAFAVGLQCLWRSVRPYSRPTEWRSSDTFDQVIESLAPSLFFSLVLLIGFIAHIAAGA